jgi:membrane protein DedA with SNARE-associated domain
MDIHITYIITSIISFLTGSIIAFIIGYTFGKYKLIQLLTKGKNPDLWNAAHYLYEAEREEKEEKTTKIINKKS